MWIIDRLIFKLAFVESVKDENKINNNNELCFWWVEGKKIAVIAFEELMLLGCY